MSSDTRDRAKFTADPMASFIGSMLRMKWEAGQVRLKLLR